MRFGLFLAVFVFFTTAVFVEPQLASAQVSLAEYAGCSGTDCSACNVVNLANGVIKWLIGFLFLIFAVIMTFAGFGLVTSGGSHHALDEAKSRFVNAVIGLMLVLSAWLIVDTIMRGLVGEAGHEGQIPKGGSVSGWLIWSEVQCYSQATTTARTFTPENFDPNEEIPGPMMNTYLIDQGGGTAGQVTINTPAGPQVVDVRPCDTANIVRINFMGGSVQIHRQFAASLQRIDERWRAMPNRYSVKTIGGYDCRKIANSTRYSNHAYGIAVDINADQNPHCKVGDTRWPACKGQNILVTDMPASFRQLFLSEGWGWGGNWTSSKDAMHFSKASGEGGNMRP